MAKEVVTVREVGKEIFYKQFAEGLAVDSKEAAKRMAEIRDQTKFQTAVLAIVLDEAGKVMHA